MAKIDTNVRGQRGEGRRIQPYAWLGAGAVTLGLGAAMAGGTAIAHADDSSSAGNNGVSHSQSSSASSKASRPATHSTPSASPASAARKATKDSGSAATAFAATAVSSTASATTGSQKPAVHSAAATVDTQALAPNTSAAPSASIPVVNQGQFIPTDITPGAHVQMAFGNISAAKTALNQNTWGKTNILGGLAAIAPNLLLSAASVELSAWQTLNPVAQNLVAGTAGIPIVHLVARVSLLGTMLLPELSQLSLKSAALLMPVVGIFAPGAKTVASPLIADATSNGLVYAIVRLTTYNTTEPILNAKINGSSNQALLVDTGSSGLVIDAANAGTLDPANRIATGQTGSYSGGFDYTYDTYKNTTVDFGNGAVSSPTYVNVVTSGTYNGQPSTLAAFLTDAGAVGILGVGANAYGPGPSPIPTSTLPGELSDGMLIYKNLLPLGLGGFVVFGPNPLPPKATLSGTPGTTLNVSINGGTQQSVVSLVDSGGVYGTIPTDLLPGSTVGDYVPSGTKISVYTPDGKTLLYSYTAGSDPYAPTVVDATNQLPDGNYLNTGYYAYNQGPVYIDYQNDGTYANGGYGWTVFDVG